MSPSVISNSPQCTRTGLGPDLVSSTGVHPLKGNKGAVLVHYLGGFLRRGTKRIKCKRNETAWCGRERVGFRAEVEELDMLGEERRG